MAGETCLRHCKQTLTTVGVAAHGVGAGRQGHHLVVGWVPNGRLHVEVVDDEVGLVPPACRERRGRGRRGGFSGRQQLGEQVHGEAAQLITYMHQACW